MQEERHLEALGVCQAQKAGAPIAKHQQHAHVGGGHRRQQLFDSAVPAGTPRPLEAWATYMSIHIPLSASIGILPSQFNAGGRVSELCSSFAGGIDRAF